MGQSQEVHCCGRCQLLKTCSLSGGFTSALQYLSLCGAWKCCKNHCWIEACPPKDTIYFNPNVLAEYHYGCPVGIVALQLGDFRTPSGLRLWSPRQLTDPSLRKRWNLPQNLRNAVMINSRAWDSICRTNVALLLENVLKYTAKYAIVYSCVY